MPLFTLNKNTSIRNQNELNEKNLEVANAGSEGVPTLSQISMVNCSIALNLPLRSAIERAHLIAKS